MEHLRGKPPALHPFGKTLFYSLRGETPEAAEIHFMEKPGASPLVAAEPDRLVRARLRFFVSRPLFSVGTQTRSLSPSELRAGVRVPARASPCRDGHLWFSDLQPFSFHFEPQCRHGDLLITKRTGWVGGGWGWGVGVEDGPSGSSFR